jgi:hypothetical protein
MEKLVVLTVIVTFVAFVGTYALMSWKGQGGQEVKPKRPADPH